ncbi:MAG: hypothetical protein OXU86_02510 [Thaumarchaeota archaeon]|nr:hypothetical protein [Nitrososphaerota archaeon]
MIVDYWLDEAGDYVGGDDAFLPYRMLAAYAGEAPRGAEPTAQEAAMARLFELRLMLDFESYRVLCAPPETSSLGYYVIESSLRYMAIEACKFDGIYQEFYGRLGEAHRDAVSHLLPVAQEASGLARQHTGRMRAARVAGGGSGPLDARGMSPESGMVACASLANMAIDGAMHAMPGEFLCALGKAAPGSHVGGLGDPEGFFRDVPGRVGARPIHCMDVGGMGAAAFPLVSELARVRWSLYADINAQRHMHSTQEGHRGVSAAGREILAQRMSWNLRHMALDLGAFLGAYREIRAATGGGGATDGVVEDAMAHEPAIRRLCGIVAHGGEPFTIALLEGIGYQRFLLLAAGVAEWAAVNVAHYRTRCPSSPPLPDLPWEGRRVDHDAVERSVSLARVRARGALARACPTAA